MCRTKSVLSLHRGYPRKTCFEPSRDCQGAVFALDTGPLPYGRDYERVSLNTLQKCRPRASFRNQEAVDGELSWAIGVPHSGQRSDVRPKSRYSHVGHRGSSRRMEMRN